MMRKFAFTLWCLLMTIGTIIAQEMKITGTVLQAEDGEPVIGASVVEKGTTNGTITDFNGQFELTVKKGADLIFSYVGMKSMEAKAENHMQIKMASDSQALDEVLVVAYGTAKKSSFTGSASTVGAAMLDMRPLSNALTALEGNASGVQMTSSIGQPGESASIRIRGFGSVNADNAPLYVVDGAIFTGDIASINPNDIESMTI